jgi:Ca2+/Na+ antiporter
MLPLLEGLDIPWENVDESFFGILLECIVLFYTFIGLAIVCDEHLVPALDTLCMRWKIPEDVAGATFMAFGSAAPEIIIAAVTTIQAADEPDPDAVALGVTSVVGSGLLAFSVIPAICGIYGSDPAGLTLKRRPLLRDNLAYLVSLLMLMYTIADGQVHAWEAGCCLTIYFCYLFVIVFARSIRAWYLRQYYPEFYHWKMAQKAAEENEAAHGTAPTDGHYEPLGMDNMDKRQPNLEKWEAVQGWSNARVRQWWLEELPPALHVYSGIVEECQLDGSDLFQLDMEMLQEFGVKRIHGMKVLKAVDRLRAEQGGMNNDAEEILRKLEHWQISGDVMRKLRTQMDGGGHATAGKTHGHGSDSESDSEDHGVFWAVFETAVKPLECLLAATCPDCEIGKPQENWYLFTFGMSFFWVAVFSFFISSIIERWVDLSGMPMSFFGLLVVSVAAQTPDTLESLAVSKKGYGSMAVANCLGTQTINIGIGLAIPWLFSSSAGAVIELEESLLVPCWIMIGLLVINLFILYTDVLFKGAEKVILNRTRAYLMSINYCLAIILYAVYLIMEGEL